ncbi:MAG TPA: cytochrome c-type biogenesis protein CcmH, partial [Dehalococcoidia bacterium]|nr:cytochrome c-type biogenesis protein CcmH [Dehalococcoidia bacterium]
MIHFPAARPAQPKLVIFLAVVLLAMLAQACASEGPAAPVEQRAQALDKEIMCPICPGESIDQSQTEYAKQIRAFVREKLAEGWSEEQIKQYYVDRFGPRILMA